MSERASSTLRGSCLCGSVTYEVAGGIGPMSHCHCTMCRKAHGAAFGTYAPVAWEAFRLLSGEAALRRYRSSATVTRTFCGNCGANLQWIRAGRQRFGLAVATLDDDPGGVVTAQIWTRHKAPWWPLTPEPPCFDTEPG